MSHQTILMLDTKQTITNRLTEENTSHNAQPDTIGQIYRSHTHTELERSAMATFKGMWRYMWESCVKLVTVYMVICNNNTNRSFIALSIMWPGGNVAELDLVCTIVTTPIQRHPTRKSTFVFNTALNIRNKSKYKQVVSKDAFYNTKHTAPEDRFYRGPDAWCTVIIAAGGNPCVLYCCRSDCFSLLSSFF